MALDFNLKKQTNKQTNKKEDKTETLDKSQWKLEKRTDQAERFSRH